MNQITSMITGMDTLFTDGKSIFWIVFSLITLTGLGLVTVGQRYYKRFLFLVGALPTYVVGHCLAAKFECLAEWHAIVAAIIIGVCMIMLSWLFIYTFGFWTVVLLVGSILLAIVDTSSITSFTYVQIGWLLACMGVAGGVFALIKQKHIIVIVTALSGTFLFLFGSLIMLTCVNHSLLNMSAGVLISVISLLFCLIAGAGIFVQYKYTADKATMIVAVDGEKKVIPNKSKFKYFILACGFGFLGVHSFYAGQYKKGFIQLTISSIAGWLYWIPAVIMQIWAFGSIFRASKNLGIVKK